MVPTTNDERTDVDDIETTVTAISKRVRKHDYPGYSVPPRTYEDGTRSKGYWQSIRRGSRDGRSGKSIIYVEVENENFWEDFANRTTRPAALWKPAIVAAFKKRYFGANAVDLTGMHWYAKAGCSMCPCSPGFILPNHHGVDFNVSVETNVHTTDPAEAEHRLLAVANDPTIPGIGVTLASR